MFEPAKHITVTRRTTSFASNMNIIDGRLKGKMPEGFVREMSKELTKNILCELSLAVDGNEPTSSQPSPLNSSIRDIFPSQQPLFVYESQTIGDTIDALAKNKACFAVVMAEQDRPIGILEVLDIVRYCNGKLGKRTKDANEFVSQLENLKEQLSTATISELIPYGKSYGKTVSASKSILGLIRTVHKYPALKLIPIINDENHIYTVVSQEEVAEFLLSNEAALKSKANHTVVELTFQRNISLCAESTDELLCNVFKVLWDKHIGGMLASSNGSSNLDLFINWLHYVHSASDVLEHEASHVYSSTTIQAALEQMLRENSSKIYVIDRSSRKTIGQVTLSDLINFFSM